VSAGEKKVAGDAAVSCCKLKGMTFGPAVRSSKIRQEGGGRGHADEKSDNQLTKSHTPCCPAGPAAVAARGEPAGLKVFAEEHA